MTSVLRMANCKHSAKHSGIWHNYEWYGFDINENMYSLGQTYTTVGGLTCFSYSTRVNKHIEGQ